MKIVIDIPKNKYEEICGGIFDADGYFKLNLTLAFKNGTPLPDNATNGDVIKTLFPNGSQVKGADIYIMNDNKSNVFYDFNWWNTSYKGGKE